MSRQEINLGTAPTGVGGDTTRSTAVKVNAMTTELYAAFGAPTGAIPAALPVAKGGTGSTDGRPAFSELEINGVSNAFGRQGLHLGWGGSGQAGFSGEATFVCNRGPTGSGGFTWVSINADVSAGGPVMTYSYSGVLKVPTISASSTTTAGLSVTNNTATGSLNVSTSTTTGSLVSTTGSIGTLSISNEISVELPVRGVRCRTGVSGAYTSNSYNLNWTGSAVDVYIANTYVGSITLFGSDYRFKKYIKTLSDSIAPDPNAAGSVPTPFLDRIDAYRIVTFQRKIFGSVFSGDGTVYQGLIAHEAQQVNPLAATGSKDGVDEDGKARIQQLEPMALITDLMGAIKELRAEVKALKAAQP